MKDFKSILYKCILFKDIDQKNTDKILNEINYNILNYKKDNIIAFEEDDCNKLGIILDGTIEVRKIYASGKNVTLTQLKAGNIFGEAIIFSNAHKYPATIIPITDCRVMFISRNEIVRICSDNKIVLKNFMNLLSNKILMLNKKVKELSLDTLREKICFYILEQYKRQNNMKIKLTMSREGLAKYMGVQRPSLSREMIKLKNDEIIDFDRNTITIKDLDLIEEILI